MTIIQRPVLLKNMPVQTLRKSYFTAAIVATLLQRFLSSNTIREHILLRHFVGRAVLHGEGGGGGGGGGGEEGCYPPSMLISSWSKIDNDFVEKDVFSVFFKCAKYTLEHLLDRSFE